MRTFIERAPAAALGAKITGPARIFLLFAHWPSENDEEEEETAGEPEPSATPILL